MVEVVKDLAAGDDGGRFERQTLNFGGFIVGG